MVNRRNYPIYFVLDWRFDLFNPYIPNVPFLNPLKKSKNLKVFWCFQEVEKGCIGNKWVKMAQNIFSVRCNFRLGIGKYVSLNKITCYYATVCVNYVLQLL